MPWLVTLRLKLVFLNFLNLPNLLMIIHFDNFELILHLKSLSVGLTKLI